MDPSPGSSGFFLFRNTAVFLDPMVNRWILLLVLAVLTTANIVLYQYREQFHYQPYAGYETLYGPCGADCENKWKRFTRVYDPAEFDSARKVLREKFHFTTSTTAEEKILSISGMVLELFTKHHGLPSPAFQRQSPMRQYNDLCLRDRGNLWCGNAAQIFSFFCFAEGILSRNIEIRNPGDHHVVTECYLPSRKQWVLLDVPHSLMMVKDSMGQLLNLQTFRAALARHQKIWARQPADSSFQWKPLNMEEMYYKHFYMGSYPYYYYYEVSDATVYSFSNKLLRYFFPSPWYEIYDENPRSNFKFYLRQIALGLWILVAILITWHFTQRRKGDKNLRVQTSE
jgi:hypothetical protein